MTSRPSWCTPACLAPAGSPAPTRGSTNSSQLRLGPEGQLPRRSDRLPAARRTAGLDRRHRRVRAPPPPTSSTSPTSCTSGCSTSPWRPRTTPTEVVPFVVPDVLKYAHFRDGFENPFHGPVAIWGDAAVVGTRRHSGTPTATSVGWPTTTPAWWCTWSRSSRICPTNGLWDSGQQLGDWLDPDASPDEPDNAKADKAVVATASFYRSVAFAAEAARLLGRTDDAARWTALADQDQSAFVDALRRLPTARSCPTAPPSTPWPSASACSTTTNALGRAPTGRGRRRARLHRSPPVSPAPHSSPGPCRRPVTSTTPTGCCSDAHAPPGSTRVSMGATTIWERWDSMLPDGSINPGDMTSFNHYALGAVADWLYQVVAGIQPAAPGYDDDPADPDSRTWPGLGQRRPGHAPRSRRVRVAADRRRLHRRRGRAGRYPRRGGSA